MRSTSFRIGAVCALLLLSCCFDDASRKTVWEASSMKPLDRLALHLSTKYKRSIDQNDFSLFYRPEPPRTIVLEVRYKRKMDQNLLRKIVTAAEENARGIGRDEFELNIETRLDERPLRTESE